MQRHHFTSAESKNQKVKIISKGHEAIKNQDYNLSLKLRGQFL